MVDKPWESPESSLGIDYLTEYPDIAADILLAWEQEWLKNAPVMYHFDTGEVWATDVLPALMAGTLSQEDREDLELYTPTMLSHLKQLHISDYVTEIQKQILKFLDP